MFAVVEIAGQQFEVKPNGFLNVPRLKGKPGDTLEFDKVLASYENEDAKIGTPYLEGSVQAKIVEHGRGTKVLVFHKKRRKGYRKLNGFKPQYTRIEITNISL